MFVCPKIRVQKPKPRRDGCGRCSLWGVLRFSGWSPKNGSSALIRRGWRDLVPRSLLPTMGGHSEKAAIGQQVQTRHRMRWRLDRGLEPPGPQEKSACGLSHRSVTRCASSPGRQGTSLALVTRLQGSHILKFWRLVLRRSFWGHTSQPVTPRFHRFVPR